VLFESSYGEDQTAVTFDVLLDLGPGEFIERV